MAGLGRSQEDLRFSGPLGLVHRTQQHPVPSVFCFCFFLSEAKEASAAISREGQWIFFWRGAGGLLLCGHFSSCSEQELLCSCCVRASHCGGSSCPGAWARGHVGFVICCAQTQ